MDDLYIKKVLNGETEEFRYFIRNYKDMAFSVALSVLKEESLAADVVQEAFIRAFQKLSSFKGKSKFSTWFYRIVVNEAIKELRKTGAKHEGLESVKESQFDLQSSEEVDVHKEGQRSFYINEALKRIAGNESLVLKLYYLNENSIKEICEITSWSEAKVKVLMHRGRKNMEKELQALTCAQAKTLL